MSRVLKTINYNLELKGTIMNEELDVELPKLLSKFTKKSLTTMNLLSYYSIKPDGLLLTLECPATISRRFELLYNIEKTSLEEIFIKIKKMIKIRHLLNFTNMANKITLIKSCGEEVVLKDRYAIPINSNGNILTKTEVINEYTDIKKEIT